MSIKIFLPIDFCQRYMLRLFGTVPDHELNHLVMLPRSWALYQGRLIDKVDPIEISRAI